jgi:hypothetical protein
MRRAVIAAFDKSLAGEGSASPAGAEPLEACNAIANFIIGEFLCC